MEAPEEEVPITPPPIAIMPMPSPMPTPLPETIPEPSSFYLSSIGLLLAFLLSHYLTRKSEGRSYHAPTCEGWYRRRLQRRDGRVGEKAGACVSRRGTDAHGAAEDSQDVRESLRDEL
jgi:hypothetical protein